MLNRIEIVSDETDIFEATSFDFGTFSGNNAFFFCLRSALYGTLPCSQTL